MIVVDNIHKSFGDAHILKGISATFEKGKTNLIIGQSGSGKTVFLKCLLGLFDSMTVEGNVMFPLNMFSKQSKSEMQDRVDFVLKRVNLIDAHHKFPSEISGGMQKRVAIARAIVMNPKYLFCDEPNSGLDPKTAILIDNLIQEITQEYDITTVINTHDMNSVMEIGEKIMFLKDGIKEWEGSNKEIFKTDNKAVTDFVYSSELFKKVRQMYIEERN